jgi:hypothetical protein
VARHLLGEQQESSEGDLRLGARLDLGKHLVVHVPEHQPRRAQLILHVRLVRDAMTWCRRVPRSSASSFSSSAGENACSLSRRRHTRLAHHTVDQLSEQQQHRTRSGWLPGR